MAVTPRCVFCELPAIKERTVLKNKLAWAFLTNIPITQGHVLISPIRCVARFDDLTTEEVGAIFELRRKLVPVLKKL